MTLSRFGVLLKFFFLVLGGRATIKDIAVSFEKVYGIKPTLESRGTLTDLYESMHQMREKNPADVFSYMSLYVTLLPYCLYCERYAKTFDTLSAFSITTGSMDRLSWARNWTTNDMLKSCLLVGKDSWPSGLWR